MTQNSEFPLAQNVPKPKSQNKWAYLFKVAGLLLGALILFWVIEKSGGVKKVWHELGKMGFGYGAVVFNSFLGIVLFTFGWQVFLPKKDHPMRFLSLLKVRLCGEGVNFMTPLGFLAGDPVRMVLLQKYLGPQSQMRSVVLDRLMHTLAAHLLNFLGLVALVLSPLLFNKALSIPLMILYGTTSFLLAKFCRDLLSLKKIRYLDFLTQKVKFFQRFPKVLQKIQDLRDDLSYYHDKPKSVFLIALALHLVGRLFGVTEIALILWCLEGRLEIEFSYMLYALTSFVTVAFGFIPGALGPLETLYAHFFNLYGLDSQVGIALQFIRRLRGFFWILIGVLIIDFNHLAQKLKPKK